MKKLSGFFWTIFCLLSLSIPHFAQSRSGGGDAGLACGMFGCMFFIWAAFILAIIGGAVALIVFIIKWIKKDALSRGMPNADSIKWLGLLGLLGLVIYLLQRPDGRMPPPNPPSPGNWQGQ
jgi:hypothetical protein